jgi:hypothetical protein
MRTAAEVGLALLGEETYQEETQKPERIDYLYNIIGFTTVPVPGTWPGTLPYLTWYQYQ